ncbi:protein of unknown function [Magnetospirillum sp. XM-1]|uniref:hypothetical protein n=1 Tax=Magnetospirillum sp. XM-1 TaxID=1663591 RepID=UPI00073E0947|nr:hypothetical protein [Magnetospirillum sp. XM-1]CUW38782.1 protein of unknown function [Magnetospirillum sp. XM-1]
MAELSDAEVFGAPQELSDADVFGAAPAAPSGYTPGEGLARVGKAVWSGLQRGGAGVTHNLANASELLDRAYGGGEVAPDNVVTNYLRGMEGRFQQRAQDIMPQDPNLLEKVYAGIGQAPVDLAMLAPVVSVMGPVAGMGAMGALGKADQGIVPAIEGGVEGLAAGKIMHGLSPYAMPTRVGGNAAFGGAQAAADPNADATDIAASAILMGGMGAPGGGTVRLRDRNVMPRRPETLTPEETAYLSRIPTDADTLQGRGVDPAVVAQNPGIVEKAVVALESGDPRLANRLANLGANRPEQPLISDAAATQATLDQNLGLVRKGLGEDAAKAFPKLRPEQQARMLEKAKSNMQAQAPGEYSPEELAAFREQGLQPQAPTNPDVIPVAPATRFGDATAGTADAATAAAVRDQAPRALPAPGQESRLPMSDTQVAQAQTEMNVRRGASGERPVYVAPSGEAGARGQTIPEQTGLALPSPEKASRLPMTEQQVGIAQKQMETPRAVPSGEAMTGYEDLAPRVREDGQRHIGEIQGRIGEDPVALVRDQLGMTENDLIRMSPDARERVVAAAQRQRGAEQPGATLHTADAGLSGREGFTPEAGGQPGATGEGRYSPATKPEPGRPGAYQPTDTQVEGRQTRAGEGQPRAGAYDRTSTGTSDRPFKMESTDGANPAQQEAFRQRAEAEAKAQRAASEEELIRQWKAREEADRRTREQTGRGEDFDARNKYDGAKAKGTFSNKPGKPDAEGRYATDEFGFVKSEKGGPVIFGDQKQAAKWIINEGHKKSPDQVFEVSNHPSGKGFTVKERGRTAQEPPKTETPAPEAQAPQPGPVRELAGPKPEEVKPVEPAPAPTVDPMAEVKAAKEREAAAHAETDRVMAELQAEREKNASNAVTEPAPAGNTVTEPQQGVPGWKPNPNLPAPSGELSSRKINPAAASEASILKTMSDNDYRRTQSPLTREQKAAAEGARQETLNRFEAAKADVAGRWENKNQRALDLALAGRDFKGGGLVAFERGWSDAVNGKLDPERTDTTKSYRYDGNYSAGVRAAEKFLADNPAPPELGGPVKVQGVTARGKGATYEMPPTERAVEGVKNNVAKLPLDRFYSNPADPALIKQMLVDPAIKAVRNFFQRERQGIERGLRGLRADPADLKSPNRLNLREALANNARYFFASNRAHFYAMEARYKDMPAVKEAVRQMSDLLGSAPGEGRLVRQGYDEAVEQRGRGMMSRMRNILEQHLDDVPFQDAVRDALAGVRTPSDPRVARVANSIRKLLDEQRDFVQKSGVEIGNRKDYFPRIVAEAKVLADTKGFLAKAEEAYRENGLDAETARTAAREWLDRIMGIGADEFGMGPASRHTKGRELTSPKTDAILKPYYETDVVSALTSYFHQTTRLAEFTTRFGRNGEKANELFDKMREGGMKAPDVSMLQSAWESSVGRVRTSWPDAMLGLSQWASTMANVALLPRAVLSSVMEPLTAGVRTGNVGDGLRAFHDTIRSVLKSKDMQDARELAEGLGLVGEAAQQMILSARWGAGLSDRHGIVVGSKKITPSRVNAMFFDKVGLAALTEHQRVASTRIGQGYVGSLLRNLERPERSASAKSMLAELGIAPEETASVKAWLDKSPSSHEIITSDAPEAKMYRAALGRFVDEVVQQPKAYDKPIMANIPVARLMYGIASFNYAFWRNVMLASGKRGIRNVAGKTGLGEKLTGGERVSGAAGIAAAYAIMSMGQVAMSNIREGAFNPSADKERQKEPIRSTMTHLDRAGMFGAASPYVNSILSVRYERDLANMFLGPGPGYFLQNAQKLIGLLPEPYGKNTGNTNTAEWNAAQAGYRLASPFASAALAVVPGGPVLNTLTGAAIMGLSSPEASTQFANAVAGEKSKGRGGPSGGKARTYTR